MTELFVIWFIRAVNVLEYRSLSKHTNSPDCKLKIVNECTTTQGVRLINYHYFLLSIITYLCQILHKVFDRFFFFFFFCCFQINSIFSICLFSISFVFLSFIVSQWKFKWFYLQLVFILAQHILNLQSMMWIRQQLIAESVCKPQSIYCGGLFPFLVATICLLKNKRRKNNKIIGKCKKKVHFLINCACLF